MQAVDQYLMSKLPQFASSKLSDLDWDILEGLESVLAVSQLCDPIPKTISHCINRSPINSSTRCHLSRRPSYHARSAILRYS